MSARRSPLLVIFVTVFIDLVGFGIVIPVLPLYGERFGASPVVVGMLLGIYSLMQFIFAPILGKLSDRVGRRPVLLLSIIGTSCGFFLMGFAHTLWLLFVARIIDGITGGNISTAMAYIADVTPPDQRSRGMGLVGAAFGLGFIFGPAIGGILGHFSLGAPFIFAAGLSLANAAAVYAWLPESLTPERRHQARAHSSIAQVFAEGRARSLPIVIGTYFFMTVAFSLLTATYALFTEHRFGYGAMQNGYIFAAQGLLGAIIQGGLLGWLVKTFTERGLIRIGSVLLGVSLFALPIGASVTALFVATAGIAVGQSLLTAPLNSLASKGVSPSSQGRVMGLMQSTASLSRIIGPVLGGWLLNQDLIHLTPSFGRTPYWVGGSIMVVAFALACQL